MITCSTIGIGDQLGAQMMTYANLYYIAKENNQELVFWDELVKWRRGYQFLDTFDCSGHKMIHQAGCFVSVLLKLNERVKNGEHNWMSEMQRIYKSPFHTRIDLFLLKTLRKFCYDDFRGISSAVNGVNCDRLLLNLQNDRNYDICSGFGTYRDWCKYKDEIINIFKFKKEFVEQGDVLWQQKVVVNRPTVGIHFRRTDYLLMSSLNLQLDYYEKAMKFFDKEKYRFVVFSDDIEACRNFDLFKDKDVVFIDGQSASVDMYLMTKCDNNIIANSTFSFWGAFLNRNEGKVVVCPHDFIGSSCTDYMFMNGNWYPEDWIAL